MIQILFMNKLSANYASMHSMGLAYSKDNEGSLYPNATIPGASPATSLGNAVPPGECFVYKWLVNDASSPDPHGNTKMWAYHSFVNMPSDTNAGLIGPTIVYNRGTMNMTMATKREFVLLYMVYDETMSFLASTNQMKYSNHTINSSMAMPVVLQQPYSGNESFWKPQLTNMPTVSLSSANAPQFYALNGRVLANNPPFEMCLDDAANWYVYGFGGASHVFHMHGNSFKWRGANYASMSLNDGNMFDLHMNATGEGTWQVLCHVNNHFMSGMVDNYKVYPKGSCYLPTLMQSFNGSTGGNQR
jgi:hypothetical protein